MIANSFQYNVTCGLALPEEPSTSGWQLLLAQFEPLLVVILLASVAVSFVLLFLHKAAGQTAFVDPAVLSPPFRFEIFQATSRVMGQSADFGQNVGDLDS